MLTKDKKKSRLDISKYLLSLYENSPEEFMHQVVTQDETCVHHFDPEPKHRICNGSTLAHPLQKSESSPAVTVTASIFWDSHGVMMVNYPEEGRPIDGTNYAEELRWLHQEIVKKRRGKLT